MQAEIINYPFDDEFDERQQSSIDTGIIYVNGHNLPDEDDDQEDDLILGDEDELDEDDLAEDEIDVEIDEDVDDVIGEDDLVLDAEEDVEEADDL